MARPKKTISIYIHFPFRDGPHGGGNQFLKALKGAFQERGWYSDDPAEADVILFNSHVAVEQVAHLKIKYSSKVFVHRVDGPMSFQNVSIDFRDNLARRGNEALADATIYQSQWSREANKLLGMKKRALEAVIPNAPDPAIFYPAAERKPLTDRKVRVAATSWSANWNKGFSTFKWLDAHLDFSRYELVFIGNSPVSFRNIRHMAPMPSVALAEELRRSDMFIFPSRVEVCANSLLEALASGLPSIVYAHPGNIEAVGEAGIWFTRDEEVPTLIDRLAARYDQYQAFLQPLSLFEVAERYYEFCAQAVDKYRRERSSRRPFGYTDYTWLMARKIMIEAARVGVRLSKRTTA